MHIDLDTSYQTPIWTEKEGEEYRVSNWAPGVDVQCLFKNGKTKIMRMIMFDRISEYEAKYLTVEHDPSKFYKTSYGGWDKERRCSKYNIDYEYEDFRENLVGVRRKGVEHLAKCLKEVQIGDIVRFKGVRDTYSWREIEDIRFHNDDPWSGICVGRKCSFKRGDTKFETLFREAYMTENSLENAIEKLTHNGKSFVTTKI